MIGTEDPSARREGFPPQRLCLLQLSLLVEIEAQVAYRGERVRVVVPHRPAALLHDLAQVRLRFRRFAAIPKEVAEIVQAHQQVGIVGPEGLSLLLERFAQTPLRLLELPLELQQEAEVVERRDEGWILLAG